MRHPKVRRWLAVGFGVLTAGLSFVAGRGNVVYCVTTPCPQPGGLVLPGLAALAVALVAVLALARFRDQGLVGDIAAFSACLAGCLALTAGLLYDGGVG